MHKIQEVCTRVYGDLGGTYLNAIQRFHVNRRDFIKECFLLSRHFEMMCSRSKVRLRIKIE